MLFAILAGFIVSLLYIPFGRFLKGRLAVLASLLPIGLFTYFAAFIPDIQDGASIAFHQPWVPSLGINFDFQLDGLSLLFSLLITGIGSLVFLYAAAYLKGHPYLDRFYAYLSLFMAAMLGVVLADNVLLLFIFWELTSISSFFLIGFNNDNADSRKSALVALGVTGGGGFLLMAGLILMGHLSGSYSIQEMIATNEYLKGHALYGLILLLVFVGAFTKSAQFPFHFWLPGAMKAPTPISAYLHSATMVKAGVYLLARLYPVLGGTDYWTYPLIIIGGITMLYGAFHSIFRTDLKGILAYSTISALGILVFLIGIGTPQSLLAAAVFILVHALYKAALFLTTGVIDHETGTRDVTQLSGLRKVLFPLAIAGLLAALSSAGLPFTFGFIGKDLVYEATLHTDGILPLVLTGLAVVTNIFLLYAGLLAGLKPFAGRLPERYSAIHLPHALMWAPPLLLAILGIAFGAFPALADASLLNPAATAMINEAIDSPLKIWHGFNTVLLLSGITLALGVALYLARKPSAHGLAWIERFNPLSPKHLIASLTRAVHRFAIRYTRTLHNGFLRVYLLRIIIFAVLLLAFRLFSGGAIRLIPDQLSPVGIYEIAVVGILVAAIYLAVTSTSRLTAVVATSVIGYGMCLLFVFYSAPDLAMTQFTIDTLTVVLFVLVLFRLPSFLNLANRGTRIRDWLVASAFGAVIALIGIQVLNQPIDDTISKFYGDNAYVLAKGKNVVNVILVDFRGFDTMFEIVVLSIAAIGVFSLLKLRLKASEKE
ncbi:putative monovalent cation/H+ antiporter subunit A [Parapedobacter koreensis]|uniref:Multisubunit sodium/proton antiporter, MrpA subunit n=1 Tax=Parapedobacter koreensis TaxID=332977 RepID=A0A1H7RSS9_9SPHI|nr:putative monovalent cation/H+ antiporter subunit A [Parapedobacter koreensis]SEL63059.1 multisubunit sodium/proton antiporter, MrpA subunit [Parapedobacter koreensis]